MAIQLVFDGGGQFDPGLDLLRTQGDAMRIDLHDPEQDIESEVVEVPVALQPAWVERLWQWWVAPTDVAPPRLPVPVVEIAPSTPHDG